ncbi:alpha-amylase, partial [Tremellales sp. Uapishka_1]
MLSILVPLLLLPLSFGMDASAARSRRVYQLVTDRFALPNSTAPTCNTADQKYCGGTWSGITSKLDYIQGMGFDTIWISPVVSNIGGVTGEGEAYHGYWTLDPSSLNSNFGTADDLKALSTALHAKNMYLMVDVVINHVAATSSSTFSPSSAYGPFSASTDFHPFCWITDYSNQTNVEQCWLGDTSVALPDLNTESATVSDYWNNWITELVSNYTIDAIRIDTVKHISKTFWPTFVNSAGVFNQGEVLNGDASYVGAYQTNASVNPFNYPVYYPLTTAFNSTSGDLAALVSMVASVKSEFSDPTLLGVFVNNADNPRFESTVTDTSLIKNAHAYALVGDGIPYVYYGSEDSFTGGADPANREALWGSSYSTTNNMYSFFTNMNAARSAAGNASSTFYTSQMNVSALSSSELLITKSPLISVLSNAGSSAANTSVTIPSASSGWAANTALTDAVSCESLTTDKSGDLALTITSGLPRVLIETSQKGTLCTDATSTTSSSSPSTTSSTKSGAGRQAASWAPTLLGAFAAGWVLM